MRVRPKLGVAAGPVSHMEIGWGILACVAIAAVGVWARVNADVSVSSNFFIGYGVALFMATSFTGVLLLWRARLTQTRASAVLAAAYAFVTPLIALYALFMPGVIFSIPHRATAWFWFFGTLGLSVGIALYALTPRGRIQRTGRATLIGVLLSIVAIAVSFMFATTIRIYPMPEPIRLDLLVVIGITDIAALVSLLTKRRRFAPLDLWLTVAVFGLLSSVAQLAFFSSGMNTIGSNIPRLLVLTAMLIVLFAMLRDFARLVARGTMLERYATMAEASPAIVYLTDANGSWTYVNERWTMSTGQDAETALGERWRSLAHPDDVEVDRRSWERAIASQEPHESELRFRTRDGNYRWHLSRALPVRDLDDTLLGWFGTALDVNDQMTAFEREHEMLQKLQTAFVPPYLPQVDGVIFDAAYRPAIHDVGGDWYDAFVLRDSRVALSVGDVAGHGWDAASAMIRLRETLRAATGLREGDPAEILELANDAFLRSHPDTIATVLFAFYDPLTRRLEYACAGHPAPALLRDGIARGLEGGGVPFGVSSHATFTTQAVTLRAGDTIALYTDGLIENDRDIIEGERRFLSAFARHRSDARQIVDNLVSGEQRDDIALVTLSPAVAARPTWHFRSDDALRAEAARASFVDYLNRNAFDVDAVRDAEMAFGELVGNVVRHAPGPIEIDLGWRDHTPVLSVRDRGPGFMRTSFHLPDDPFAESGRGLFLVSISASSPVVRRRPGGGSDVSVALKEKGRVEDSPLSASNAS